MVKYILKRVAILLVTLWVVVTLSFFLMQVMPGTPYNNPKLTDEMIALMNKQYGLDKPVWQQYLTYLWNILHGDFGTSYQSINQPVGRLISQRLGVSIQLGVQALIVGLLSGIVVGLIWKFIYDGNFGVLNTCLISLGLEQFKDFAWLSEIKTALSSVAVVHMWKGFGYGFIIFLAGLQTIPNELYESAEVDGANKWQQFINVTVPSMIPVFTMVSVLTVLGAMQIFDLIYSMTQGGPAGHTDVPITKIYQYMNNGEFGYSTAMAVVFGMLLLIVSLIQFYISKKIKD